jgi:hypothetical protein
MMGVVGAEGLVASMSFLISSRFYARDSTQSLLFVVGGLSWSWQYRYVCFCLQHSEQSHVMVGFLQCEL